MSLDNGETGRRLVERVNEHSGIDINSHMFKHSIKANHPTVTLDNFIVLSSGYCNRKFTEFSRGLFRKDLRFRCLVDFWMNLLIKFWCPFVIGIIIYFSYLKPRWASEREIFAEMDSTRFIIQKLCVGFSIFYSVSFLLKFIISFNQKYGRMQRTATAANAAPRNGLH